MTPSLAKVTLRYESCKSSQDYYSRDKHLHSLRGNSHERRKEFSLSDWLSVYWKVGKYHALSGSHCLSTLSFNGRDVSTAVSLQTLLHVFSLQHFSLHNVQCPHSSLQLRCVDPYTTHSGDFTLSGSSAPPLSVALFTCYRECTYILLCSQLGPFPFCLFFSLKLSACYYLFNIFLFPTLCNFAHKVAPNRS